MQLDKKSTESFRESYKKRGWDMTDAEAEQMSITLGNYLETVVSIYEEGPALKKGSQTTPTVNF